MGVGPNGMSGMKIVGYRRRKLACLAAAFAACALLIAPDTAKAQVAVLVNGAPITEMDITQRSKLTQLTANKNPSRKEVIDDLINDHLKIFIAKRYGLEITDADVNNAFSNMAQRSRGTAAQMEQSLASRGIGINNLKLRIRAELGWGQLVRGRFGSSLQIGEADIQTALQSRSEEEKSSQSFLYKIYPVIFVGSGDDADGSARRREAENLRARFNSCDQDLRTARSLRGVVVKAPIMRNSAELSAQLREVLDKIEIGKLTAPEVTAQGIQMFAVCERKASTADSPIKRQLREEMYNKRYETQSKKFLDDIRRQAMIEYR
jgi:peptidyl-prolyl cis-trans isomerase SurA